MIRVPLPSELADRPFRVSSALALGVSPDRLRSDDLWTPTRGVRTTEIPTTLLERAQAFAAAPGGPIAFSHVTAAQLLGLPVPYAAEEDCLLHVMSTTADNRMRRDEVAGHRGLESRTLTEVSGLPVVSAADTWVDLGEYVGPGRPIGLDDLIAAGDAAANLEGGIAPLKRAVEARVRPRGKVTLTYALPRIRMGSASAMESRSRLMVVRAGLPEPELNGHIISTSGAWLACSDLVWRRKRVVGEYQGVEFHSRPADRARDRVRFELLRSDGWRVVEIDSEHVFDVGPRELKLRELAFWLGVSSASLNLDAAAPQFVAPPQFRQRRRRNA